MERVSFRKSFFSLALSVDLSIAFISLSLATSVSDLEGVVTVVTVTKSGTGLVLALICIGAKENSKKAAVMQSADFFIVIIFNCEQIFTMQRSASLTLQRYTII